MPSRRLEKDQWQTYCERVSRGLTGKRIDIEVAALDVGDQIQAEHVPVLGIAYDPKNDLVEVALEGLDHLIRHPREISIEEGTRGLISMEVVDADQTRQILKFEDPLMLPSRAAG
jgi:hypothetical protein